MKEHTIIQEGRMILINLYVCVCIPVRLPACILVRMYVCERYSHLWTHIWSKGR